jgi:hypothetical protein
LGYAGPCLFQCLHGSEIVCRHRALFQQPHQNQIVMEAKSFCFAYGHSRRWIGIACAVLWLLGWSSCRKEPGFGGDVGFTGVVEWSDTLGGDTKIPVGGAKVRIYFAENSFLYETQSDAGGQYSIEGLHLRHEGRVELSAVASRIVRGVSVLYTDTVSLGMDSLLAFGKQFAVDFHRYSCGLCRSVRGRTSQG